METFTRDPCTFSNPNFYELKHLSLDWNVNFDTKIIDGKCCLEFQQNQKLSSEKQLVTK